MTEDNILIHDANNTPTLGAEDPATGAAVNLEVDATRATTDKSGHSVAPLEVTITNPELCTTGTQTSVASSTTDTTILASNANRKGAAIYNDSTSVLYLLLASGVSSNSNYTIQLVAAASYEVPFGYTGVIKGLWAVLNGNARVTEFS